MRNTYSIEFLREFKKWFSGRIAEGILEFNDYDELVYNPLEEDDKERVRTLLKKYSIKTK